MGEKLFFFKPLRGIRQSDPISSYLFILCMKRLFKITESTVNFHPWHPIKISNKSISLSYCFVDDLTCKATKDNCLTSMDIHNKLVPTLTKKSIITNIRPFSLLIALLRLPINAQRPQHFRVSSTFEKYLVFPIFHRSPTNKDIQFIINYMNNRLTS